MHIVVYVITSKLLWLYAVKKIIPRLLFTCIPNVSGTQHCVPLLCMHRTPFSHSSYVRASFSFQFKSPQITYGASDVVRAFDMIIWFLFQQLTYRQTAWNDVRCPTKCGKLRNAITYNVIWANQKSESFVYRCLRALVWRNSLSRICRSIERHFSLPSIY